MQRSCSDNISMAFRLQTQAAQAARRSSHLPRCSMTPIISAAGSYHAPELCALMFRGLH